MINKLPRWGNSNGWLFPASHMLRADLEPLLRSLVRGADQYRSTFNDLEYRVGLAGFKLAGRLRLTGEFLLDSAWTGDRPNAEIAFREAAARAGSTWPWWSFLGCDGPGEVDAYLAAYRGELEKHQRWG